MLSNQDFRQIIQLTPLISVDLILNFNNKYLFGFRKNDPAKNFWFVPGGRILKDESIENAIKRISLTELGFQLTFDKLKFNKITEHFYNNNFFDDKYSTHYISLSYIYNLSDNEFNNINLNNQHTNSIFFNLDDISNNINIHHYSKILFN